MTLPKPKPQQEVKDDLTFLSIMLTGVMMGTQIGPDEKLKLGLIVEGPDGSGRITARFEIKDFLDDLKRLTSPSHEEMKERWDAIRALKIIAEEYLGLEDIFHTNNQEPVATRAENVRYALQAAFEAGQRSKGT